MEPTDRLFGYKHAFDHGVTVAIVVAAGVLVLLSPAVISALWRWGRIGADHRGELVRRVRSWAVLAIAIIVPVLLGAAWTILGITFLSLVCYREYARATGLFRERAMSAIIVIGIFAVGFAALDHYYQLFVALAPLTVIAIATTAICYDRPDGYIQRVGLASIGFLLFGVCMGHIAYIANDPLYRPVVLMIFLGVSLNDVFAYIIGKAFGRRRLAPNTSPNKTVAGALGGIVFTTLLVAALAHSVFRGEAIDVPIILIGLGLIVAAAGQMGDLMISSIKRDIGIKDMSAAIPGHGGFLDRFDSLILVGPAVFHYVGYFRGFGLDQATRLVTGGGL